MRFITSLRNIKKTLSSYTPLVEVVIHKEHLLHNLHAYQKAYPDFQYAPVLKSNAYGHGFLQIARLLDKEDIAFFVVDSLFEAKAMRNEGISSPILVIGYTSPHNIAHTRLRNVAFTITDIEQLRIVSKVLKKKRTFHLKIDTGMHRQGVLPEELSEALALINSCRTINLEGVCSHLADADNSDAGFTKQQLRVWDKIVKECKEKCSAIRYFHTSATAGLAHREHLASNLIRLGIGLYGISIDPSSIKMKLKPVLQVESTITSVKRIAQGEFIGYNITHQVKKDTLVATVPVGYAEGVDRRLSNTGHFKVGNRFCPIVGRVSMNITSIDVGAVPKVKIGDKVVIISADEKDPNSAQAIARLTKTIPYEVLIRIPQYLRRTVK